MKLTKQGVRDLNSIKAPPRKIRTLEGLPSYLLGECKHPKHFKHNDQDGNQFCKCGMAWDFEGRELRSAN